MFNKSLLTDGIYFLTHPNNSFEQTYIDIRKKEGNLLTIPQILALPNSEQDSTKWKMRKASAYFEQISFTVFLQIANK